MHFRNLPDTFGTLPGFCSDIVYRFFSWECHDDIIPHPLKLWKLFLLDSLTKAKSVVVSRPMLTEKAKEIDLPLYLRLGKGEEANHGRERPNNVGNAFEALMGVIFLERGFSYASRFVMRYLKDEIERCMTEQSATGDYKSLLQETAQRLFSCRPAYSLSETKGKAHRAQFTVTVAVAGHRGNGRGRSKKEAEQAAAKQLYLMLEEF